MKLVFCLGLFFAATVLSFGQTEKAKTTEKATQKSEQHVKVMLKQNGNTIELDSTFHLGGEKEVQLKVDSILKKLEVGNGKSGEPHVVIMRRGGKTSMTSHAGNRMPGEVMYTVIAGDLDSGKVKGERKVMRMHDAGDFAIYQTDGGMVPPPPPPPMPPFGVHGFKISHADAFAMDPNDADIISYDKKDIGKGLEKITIVRKKHASQDESKEVEVQVTYSDDKKGK